MAEGAVTDKKGYRLYHPDLTSDQFVSKFNALSGGSGLPAGTSVIQAALNAAVVGETVVLAAGTFVENAGIEIPNGVHLRGAGRGKTIISSTLLGTSAPFHGIIAPGNNSIIEDLSVTTTVTGHCNSVSRRAGCTKSWTNVTFRNCYLGGGADVVFSSGGMSLGDMRFEYCLLECPNDLVIFQTPGNLVFDHCELRHTTGMNGALDSLSSMYLFDGGGGNSNTVKAYGCLFSLKGIPTTYTSNILFEAGDHMELHDCIIDLGTQSLPGWHEFGADNPGALIVSNLKRADGKNLVYDYAGQVLQAQSIISCVIARLPTAPAVGQTAVVTDGAASLAWGATITGGSTNKYLVMWNGTNWTVVGK